MALEVPGLYLRMSEIWNRELKSPCHVKDRYVADIFPADPDLSMTAFHRQAVSLSVTRCHWKAVSNEMSSWQCQYCQWQPVTNIVSLTACHWSLITNILLPTACPHHLVPDSSLADIRWYQSCRTSLIRPCRGSSVKVPLIHVVLSVLQLG